MGSVFFTLTETRKGEWWRPGKIRLAEVLSQPFWVTI
jgi:hypothetical protein